MKTLFILNDAPYGTERSYNGLRLAGALAKRKGDQVKIFLIGDAVSCSRAGQKLPQGCYNIEVMLKSAARNNGEISVCSTCMDARGMTEDGMIEEAKRSTLDELTAWTVWADKVISF